jgi:hypothetical protein
MPTHAHLDLIVWFDFLLGFGFWLCNTCDASIPHLYTLLWAPYIAIIRSMLKKDNLMSWWRLYTLSDLKESNEEPSKVCFENLLKNPNLLDIRSRMIWFKIVSFLNYARWHDRHFKFTSTKYGLEYLLCLLHTFGIMFSPWSLTFTRGRAKDQALGSLLTVLTTIFWPSLSEEWEEDIKNFMHILSTNEVPRALLIFLLLGTQIWE